MTRESRRRQLLLAGVCAAAGVSANTGAAAVYRGIAFDGFAIFDPRPVAAKAEMLFPGRGVALMAAWRNRQFEYQWLRALADDYADFVRTTRDGLVFAAGSLDLELSPRALDELVGAYGALDVWPDVPGALKAIHAAGLKLAIVSNFTQPLLEDGLRRASLERALDHVLSTDAIRSFKPSPRAYQLGVDAMRLQRAQILFVPFAGWDAAGAKTFGHPTFWVNRLQAPIEQWGPAPDGMGRDMTALLKFLDIADA